MRYQRRRPLKTSPATGHASQTELALSRYPLSPWGRRLLVRVSIGQQSQITCAFDCCRQLTLVLSFGACNTARYNFTGFGDVRFQRFQIFVIDLLYAFGGKTTKLTTSKKS